LAGSCGPGNRDHPRTVRIGFVAKYMDNTDTYMSVFEAVKSAAWHNRCAVEISWIDAAEVRCTWR